VSTIECRFTDLDLKACYIRAELAEMVPTFASLLVIQPSICHCHASKIMYYVLSYPIIKSLTSCTTVDNNLLKCVIGELTLQKKTVIFNEW
jgi:hypothetical protein